MCTVLFSTSRDHIFTTQIITTMLFILIPNSNADHKSLNTLVVMGTLHIQRQCPKSIKEPDKIWCLILYQWFAYWRPACDLYSDKVLLYTIGTEHVSVLLSRLRYQIRSIAYCDEWWWPWNMIFPSLCYKRHHDTILKFRDKYAKWCD